MSVNAPAGPVLAVTVYSDVICPWCYVGKRRFEAALSALDLADQVAIAWRPFELNPDMPDGGMERSAYRAQKFGAERAAQFDRQLAETGREAGIMFAFDTMAHTPNTRQAHRLIWAAGLDGLEPQNALVERLFKAYFEDGLDIGDRSVLSRLGEAVGMTRDQIHSALATDHSLSAVLELEEQGLRMGIQGVPFFIVINKYAVSGAQGTEVWQQALPQFMAEASAA
jgi:predicted DsbA family dithiol-disulfide isomerase